VIRIFAFAALLNGCGLIAGLRTDYVLSDAALDAPGDANADADANAGSDAAATCADMIQNGVETDVDCGGGQCPKCTNGKTCVKNSDCQSDNCTQNKCRP